jgi:hypothetical protein
MRHPRVLALRVSRHISPTSPAPRWSPTFAGEGSPKPVEANPARVYRMLGISSRAQLGARMA